MLELRVSELRVVSWWVESWNWWVVFSYEKSETEVFIVSYKICIRQLSPHNQAKSEKYFLLNEISTASTFLGQFGSKIKIALFRLKLGTCMSLRELIPNLVIFFLPSLVQNKAIFILGPIWPKKSTGQ